MRVELQLNAAEACFEPWLKGTTKPSVRGLLEGWMQGCIDCASLVTQLQTGTGKQGLLRFWLQILSPFHLQG